MLAGAVLCGGRSSRMGADKALIPVDGVPMARRVADSLVDGGCEAVAAIGGDAAALTSLGLPVVPDGWPGDGPVGGVVTALRSSPEAAVVVVVACDLPRLTGVSVRALLAALDADASVGVAVAVTDRVQPMCAAWRRSALPVLEAAFAAGERRLHVLVERVGAAEVAVDPTEMLNVNAPADLPSRL